MDASAYAVAGDGGDGYFDRDGGAGADATALADATGGPQGDPLGDEMLVGLAPRFSPGRPLPHLFLDDRLDADWFRSGAKAGSGGDTFQGGRGGRGGTAASQSSGVALGDTEVAVWDAAFGGDAGYGPVQGGDGGDATSSAFASAEGDARVGAHSYARAGDGGENSDIEIVDGEVIHLSPAGAGGAATARAEAHGLGEVFAEARADGGIGVARTGGVADATATASGGSGLAAALATSSFDGDHGIRASAAAEIAGAASANAYIGFAEPGLALAGASSPHAASLDVIALPGAAQVAAALAGNPEAAAALAAAGSDSAAVLAAFGGRNDGSEASILLGVELELDVAFTESLQVSFLDPELVGDGFDTLRLQIARGTDLLLDQLFDDDAAALAFFDDHVLDFGSDPLAGTLRITLEWTAGLGDGFGGDFLVLGRPALIPEPAPAALLALGLVALALSRRRR